MGYHWHLRSLMAQAGMFATTDLVPLLAERGVVLSREQVYRLVARVPERLSLTTLSALCDILSCSPSELIEPYRTKRAGPHRSDATGTAAPPRPTRARVLPAPTAIDHAAAPDSGCQACRGRRCSAACRRARIITAVTAAVPELPAAVLAEAVDAVLRNPAITRSLAAALTADPAALLVGAPPVVGKLIGELRARGADLPDPTCTRCGRTGKPLTRSPSGGVCARCRRRQLAAPCTRCGVVKPVAGRDAQNRPVCARCADRPQRPCGRCGRTRRIARRAHDGIPDICDGCFRMPEAVCSRCQRRRPCSFAAGPEPVCIGCTPRATAVCAHCGADRPPTARWPEGPVCDPCYNAALRRRGTCASCRCHASARRPTRPGRDHLRGLRRPAHHRSHLHGLRARGQTLRTRPVRTLRAAAPHPRTCSAAAPSRSHPRWPRSTKRSPPPTPRAPR